MKNNIGTKILHIDKSNYTPIATVKQEDNITMTLELYKEGLEFDITGQTVTLAAKRADKVIVEQIDGFSIDTNSLTIELRNNINAKIGLVYLELNIKDSKGSMTTLDFYLKVVGKILGEDSLDASDNIASLEKIQDEFIKSSNALLDTVIKNEDDRVDAEAIRQGDESTRSENEASRINAESERMQAENARVIAEQERALAEVVREERNKEISLKCTKMEDDYNKALANITNGNESVTNSEIVQARGKAINLGVRLDGFDSRLSGKEIEINGINSSFNAQTYIDSFDNQYEMLHPSLKFFEDGWNGWKYWLVYTPMPTNKSPYTDRYECPCIAVSNDLLNWQTPVGLKNPIIDLNEEEIERKDYFSDPSMVINNNVMEIWYRKTNGSNPNITDIYRISSTDGVNWTNIEKVVDSQNVNNGLGEGLNNTMRSQQILYENGEYISYYGGHQSGAGVVVTKTNNPSTGIWSTPVKINFIDAPYDFTVWHFGLIKENKYYYMIAYDSVYKRLVYFKSDDGLNFRFKKIIAVPTSQILDYYQSYPFFDGKWNVMTTILTYSNLDKQKYGFALLRGDSLELLTYQNQNFFNNHLFINGDVILANNSEKTLYNSRKFVTKLSPDRTKKYAFGTDMETDNPIYQKGEQFLGIPICFKQSNVSIKPDAEYEFIFTNDKMIYISRSIAGEVVWQEITTDGVNNKNVINTSRKNVNANSTIDVSGYYRIVINTGSATDINNFINGVDGQEIFVLNVTLETMTIINNAPGEGSIKFDSNKANIELKPFDSITLIKVGTSWYIK